MTIAAVASLDRPGRLPPGKYILLSGGGTGASASVGGCVAANRGSSVILVSYDSQPASASWQYQFYLYCCSLMLKSLESQGGIYK